MEKGAGFVLVDAGSLISWREKKPEEKTAAIVDAMNKMGYDCANIGLTEANCGEPCLDRYIGTAQFPVISASGDENNGLSCPRFHVVKVQGLTVALIGLLDPKGLPEGSGKHWKTMGQALRDTLRKVDGDADLVVLLADGEYDDVVNAVSTIQGIDLVILGSGRNIREVNGVVFSARSMAGSLIALVKIRYDMSLRKIVQYDEEIVWLDDSVPGDESLEHKLRPQSGKSVDRAPGKVKRMTFGNPQDMLKMSPDEFMEFLNNQRTVPSAMIDREKR